MPRPSRSRLTPWIESLILSYGSPEGARGSSALLKAHVIGVGQMSQSQAQGSEGPTGLLFLSDGVLQIPAVLTASAWEHLQEQEDRECFTSLVNTTVCIQDYQLQFHMALEQTKCRFFLSVGELVTTAVGPIKESTPCCTTQPSVRMQICKAWKLLLGQAPQSSQSSQCGFDLSVLLGEWQHDCLQTVLKDVREKLMMASSCPVSPRPSTSTYTSSETHLDRVCTTGWDDDRVTFKAAERFSVPVQFLLIPEHSDQQLQTPSTAGSTTPSVLCSASEDRNRDSPPVCQPSETSQPSVHEAQWQISEPAVVETDRDASENSHPPVEDSLVHEVMIVGLSDYGISPLSNPWDIFPPPCETFSSSDASPEASPNHAVPHSPSAAQPKLDHAAVLTSTQLPVHNSMESQQTTELSKGEHSYLPPYQTPPKSASPHTTGSSSSLFPATDEDRTSSKQPEPLGLEEEIQVLEKKSVERINGKAGRKRRRSQPETLSIDEEEERAQISGSPPSWLFDTSGGPTTKEGRSQKQGQTVGTARRKTPTVHSDGSHFSYSYKVSGRNLQDFSQFRVAEQWLQWAVKYLVVPKQTDNLHNTSGVSDQMSPDRPQITSL